MDYELEQAAIEERAKYRAESLDIDDIEYEEADIINASFEEITESEADNPNP